MEELLEILADVEIAVRSARISIDRGDVPNVLYNVDHAEIDLLRARNIIVSIMHHGEGN